MIVQGATADQTSFVITMGDHTAVAGQLARAFGNERFGPLEPSGIFEDVVANHDAGWAELDARVLQDPDTGLPYHLADTPPGEMVATISKSPDANEAVHPYGGIISSMHSYGLYHGRYGLNERRSIELLPDELRSFVTEVLDGEVERQKRLKAQLAADDATAAWVTDEALFRNYRLLQFFDSLALYLQCDPPGRRGSSRFGNVPRREGDDVTVSAVETAPGTVAIVPWPFAGDSLTVATSGRVMKPAEPGTDLVPMFNATPITQQVTRLVAVRDPA